MDTVITCEAVHQCLRGPLLPLFYCTCFTSTVYEIRIFKILKYFLTLYSYSQLPPGYLLPRDPAPYSVNLKPLLIEQKTSLILLKIIGDFLQYFQERIYPRILTQQSLIKTKGMRFDDVVYMFTLKQTFELL